MTTSELLYNDALGSRTLEFRIDRRVKYAKNMRNFVIFLFLFYLLQDGSTFKHSFGDCPKIKGFERFDMNKFLGTWYAVRVNDNNYACGKFTFTKTNKTNKYSILESSNDPRIDIAKYYFSRTGELKVTDNNVPASMKIKWHWSSPSEEMVVFDTDYTNYTGVMFCSKTFFVSQTRIFILSRSLNITRANIDQVKESLKLNQFDSDIFHTVDQKKCTDKNSKDTFKIQIENDSLSPKSVGKYLEKKWKENFDKKDCSNEEEESTTGKN
ncbi:hypothetical protein HHI36_021073 [Cryptolaemus montrouzieri]|uniref:Uncharacterized protein n=1 Tax=Cryptolaemus montrouzieri TaxID=559131 RepID=A0ABD2MW19_9CUCU